MGEQPQPQALATSLRPLETPAMRRCKAVRAKMKQGRIQTLTKAEIRTMAREVRDGPRIQEKELNRKLVISTLRPIGNHHQMTERHSKTSHVVWTAMEVLNRPIPTIRSSL